MCVCVLCCCSCGALSVGDQVLSIDDAMIEHTAYSPDEVMTILDTSTGRGYTQMQIMPAHALARRGKSTKRCSICSVSSHGQFHLLFGFWLSQ